MSTDRHGPWLDVLRHGQTTLGQCYLGRSDPPLSAKGFAQMEQAIAELDWTGYQQVVTSPLRRCREFTAQCCPRQWRQDMGIREYDFGDWEGASAAAIYQRTPDALVNFWQDPVNYPPPNAEPLPVFFARIRAWLASYRGQTVLLISHGGVAKAIHCLMHQQPPAAMAAIQIPHASLTRFYWSQYVD